jgi:membrane fusion protein, multidrug efflux system
MNHKWFCFIVGIVLISSSCQSEYRKKESVETAIPVVAAQARVSVINNEISISGNIEGNRTVRLGFTVAGKINFIAANEGQSVAKDQLLSSIDSSGYAIAKEIADVQVAQVEDEFNRLKAMHEQHSISESDFAKINFGLQQAKAQQKLHAKNLADTKLYVPFSGVLLRKLCEVGEITGVGIPQFVVSDIRKVKVSAFIPENELHLIRIGQEARVVISALNETFNGKIVEVGSAADPASRSFTLKIELDNPKLLIRPGMIAEVTIACDEKSEVLTIPAEAILHDVDNQSYVYITDVTKGKAFKRIVGIGKLQGVDIEITSGLNENEFVVTGGKQKLVDGASITIQK